MRKIFFTIFSILVFQIGMAQDGKPTPNSDDWVYSSVGIEKQPEFPGGVTEFLLYVQRHYMYPVINVPLKGKVLVQFVIEKDGTVDDIKVIRDLGYGTGEEAVRLLQNCPKWEPGMQDGRLIRVRYLLPINIDVN